MRELRYFSTFSGIGGFELAIERAAKLAFLAPTCVGYSEINPYSISVYERHFKEHKNYGDITKINTDTLPDFDLLVGGFPCQSHSILGKRAGLNDERGEVFFDLVRVLKAKRPKYFVFENVKGLLSSNNGEAFRTILTSLDELGYYVEWRVLNGTHFGTPQERERIAIVGVLGGTPRTKILSFAGKQATRTHLDETKFVSYCRSRDKVMLKNVANTLTASYTGLGSYNEPGVIDGGEARRLLPIECERLQGFPDNWTAWLGSGKRNSDSQRYKQCGNAICVPMFVAVFESLFRLI